MRLSAVVILVVLVGALAIGQSPQPAFTFAVSGDSRNCGDVVMPAIAAAVAKTNASFYWHLGDFRAIYDFDEDMVGPGGLDPARPHTTIAQYLTGAWPDFVEHQLKPFGSLELFLAPGNHEMIFPMSRESYLKQFRPYLDSARLRRQRILDHTSALPQPYYHWVMNNSVDFISLDNSLNNTFDAAQLRWITARLEADRRSKTIRTVVVGAHEALPGSKGLNHSMCDSPAGVTSGREVYQMLWNLQQSGKKVYLLASHSHFVMDDVYRTDYWKGHVLPGWIIGTAGAVRYRIPTNVDKGSIARTDVYGFLFATVMSDGTVNFEFRETPLDALRAANTRKLPDSLLQWCVNENRDTRTFQPTACGEPAK
jgi:hypothetical protein